MCHLLAVEGSAMTTDAPAQTPFEKAEPDVAPASSFKFDLPGAQMASFNDLALSTARDAVNKEFRSADDILGNAANTTEKTGVKAPDGLDKYRSALVLASNKPELKDGENVIKDAKVDYDKGGKEVKIDFPGGAFDHALKITHAKPYFDKQGNLCVEGVISYNKETGAGFPWAKSEAEKIYGQGTIRLSQGENGPKVDIWNKDGKYQDTLTPPKAKK
jgi:hypothetical protein